MVVETKKPDGRTYAAGKTPKQVVKQQNAKRTRCHRKRMKAEEDMKVAKKQLANKCVEFHSAKQSAVCGI